MNPSMSTRTLAKCHQKWLALAAIFPAAETLALANRGSYLQLCLLFVNIQWKKWIMANIPSADKAFQQLRKLSVKCWGLATWLT